MSDELNQAALEAVVDQVMDNIVDRIFEKSQRRLVEPHTKYFKSGKTATVITTDRGTLLKTANIQRAPLMKKIVYPAPYASDVEYGNAAPEGKIDLVELKGWVKRKVLDGKKSSELSVNRLTLNIAKALKERGQSADPYLNPSVWEVLDEMERGIF